MSAPEYVPVYISGSRATLLDLADEIREAAMSDTRVSIKRTVIGPLLDSSRTLTIDNEDMENRPDLDDNALVVYTEEEA